MYRYRDGRKLREGGGHGTYSENLALAVPLGVVHFLEYVCVHGNVQYAFMYSVLKFSLPPLIYCVFTGTFRYLQRNACTSGKKYVFKKSRELNINESVYTHQRIPWNPCKNSLVPRQKILFEYNKITLDSTGQTLPGTVFGNFLWRRRFAFLFSDLLKFLTFYAESVMRLDTRMYNYHF
jgi:hypothetical protein